jgi:hypothetical protein
MDEEHIQLRRGWRDASIGFRRRLEATWFAYFEHLGLTADYFSEPLLVQDRTFQPSLWVREWSAFVYVLPPVVSPNEHQRQLMADAVELSKRMVDFDVIVAFGNPDELTSYIELHSSAFSKFLHSWTCDKTVPTNRWTISGSIDRQECIAYYWMLISADNFGYIPGTRQWYSVCFCGGEACQLCKRFENFSPVDAYGTTFGIDINRHLPCEPRKKRKRMHGVRLCGR